MSANRPSLVCRSTIAALCCRRSSDRVPAKRIDRSRTGFIQDGRRRLLYLLWNAYRVLIRPIRILKPMAS
uniref:Uncharacterized protein n=1 Tax=Plectus sambesii TaxID=2011161 RepID=A0A914WD01_9BILA